MATVALCPNCGSQLGVPVAASDAAALQCPMCEAQFAREASLLHDLPMARVVVVEQQASFDPNWRLSDHFDPAVRRAASGGSTSDVGADGGSATSIAAETPSTRSANGEPITAATIAAEAARLEELLRNLPAEAGAPGAMPSSPDDETHVETRGDDLAHAADLESPALDAPHLEAAARELDYQTLDNPSTNVDEELDAYDDLDEAAYDESDEDDYDEEAGYGQEHAADAHSGRRHREFVLRPSPKRRPRTSLARSIVGIVGGGVVGLLLAGYVLIWLRGPELDFFQMAGWMPAVLLPESMQEGAGRLADSAKSREVDDSAARDDERAAEQDDDGDSNSFESGFPLTSAGTPPVVDDPAVMQANHTDPSDAADEEPAADVVDSAPIAARESSPANWPATPIVADLESTTLYSLDELTGVVVPAEDAARRFLSGDFSSPESQTRMGHAYIKLCAVAERFTLTDPKEYGSHLFTQQMLGKGPLQSVAANAARRGDLSRIAAKWWQYPKRQNHGLLAVGRVTELHPQGRWTEATLELEGVEPPVMIPVLMDGVRFTTGTEVAVAGVIVPEPQQRIKDYKGSAEQVVIGGYLFDPAKFAESPAAAPEF